MTSSSSNRKHNNANSTTCSNNTSSIKTSNNNKKRSVTFNPTVEALSLLDNNRTTNPLLSTMAKRNIATMTQKDLDNLVKRNQMAKQVKQVTMIRRILLSGVFGYIFQKHILREYLLPYGPALLGIKEIYKSVDITNDLLQIKHGNTYKIYESIVSSNNDTSSSLLLNGPETIVFDNDGNMYALTEDSKLVQLYNIQEPTATHNVTAVFKKDLGIGRPLGSIFTNEKSTKGKNTIYICIAGIGLTRIIDIHNPLSKLEIIASHVIDEMITTYKYEEEITSPKTNDTDSTIKSKIYTKTVLREENITEYISTPISYANDVTVGPKSGLIYFTDATNIPPDRISRTSSTKASSSCTSNTCNSKAWNNENNSNKQLLWKKQITQKYYGNYHYDTLYGSKIDLLRYELTGRLLEYNPYTDEVRILYKKLRFANGISSYIDDHGDEILIIAETFGIRIQKYNTRTGIMETILDGKSFQGYLDGVECISHPLLDNKNNNKKNINIPSTLCFAVMPSSIVLLGRILNSLPLSIGRFIRTLLMALPRTLLPKMNMFGGLIQFNPDDATDIQYYLDPTGIDIQYITGVTYHNGKLYLGSIVNHYIGVYNIHDVLEKQQEQKQQHEKEKKTTSSSEHIIKNDEL